MDWTAAKDYLIIGCSLVGAIWLSAHLGLNAKWEHSLSFSAILFSVVITSLRQLWRHSRFWGWLALLFLLHVLAISAVTYAIPDDSHGIRGVPALGIGILEGLFLLNVLWVLSRPKPS